MKMKRKKMKMKKRKMKRMRGGGVERIGEEVSASRMCGKGPSR